MKSKIIFFLAISAVVTLSFTFSSVSKADKKSKEVATEKQASNAPAGGFASEDKF
jgi:hypothetical protein